MQIATKQMKEQIVANIKEQQRIKQLNEELFHIIYDEVETLDQNISIFDENILEIQEYLDIPMHSNQIVRNIIREQQRLKLLNEKLLVKLLGYAEQVENNIEILNSNILEIKNYLLLNKYV